MFSYVSVSHHSHGGGGGYVSSDDHQVSLGGVSMFPVMATRGMSRRGWGYIQRGICLGGGYSMGPGITITHHY